jgi:outer membrane receptor protein involved in Fe transport
MLDKRKFPDIACANEAGYKGGASPFYTNSTQLPVNYTDDIFETLMLQDEMQTRYTGGTVQHIYLGEEVTDSHADTDAGEKELPSWDVFNIRAGYAFNKYVALTVGVDNLFNETYAVANSYELDPLTPGATHVAIVNEPGRFYYASLSLTF